MFEKNLKQAEKLKPYVGNVIQEVRDLQEADKKILFEKPDVMDYPKTENRFKHYGKSVKNLIVIVDDLINSY